MNFAPFCCDGLSLLEQGLHALSLGVRLPLGSHLLLQLFATARLLLSFGFRCCLWWDWYSQLRIFEDVRCLDQKMIAWPSFIMGADIVGLNGDFGLNPVLLPVKKVVFMCFICLPLFCFDFLHWSRVANLSPALCSALGSDISPPLGATYWQLLPPAVAPLTHHTRVLKSIVAHSVKEVVRWNRAKHNRTQQSSVSSGWC